MSNSVRVEIKGIVNMINNVFCEKGAVTIV